MEVAFSSIRHPVFVGDILDEKHQERQETVRSVIRDWTAARMKRRESLIKTALLRFLTELEIELTSLTKCLAIMNYYGLKIEHILPPTGHGAETLSIYRDGKLVEFVNLDSCFTLSDVVPETHL